MPSNTFTCSVVIIVVATTVASASTNAFSMPEPIHAASAAQALSSLAEKALVKIAMRPALYPSELAHTLGVSLTEAGDAVDELLRAGLIGRSKA